MYSIMLELTLVIPGDIVLIGYLAGVLHGYELTISMYISLSSSGYILVL